MSDPGELEAPLVTRTSAPIRSQVTAYLRSAIAAGRYRPGEHLVERSLRETLGISRSTLREALRELESEGLVEAVPGVGLVVASVGENEIRDLYAVRRVLENLAIDLFLQLATPEDIAALETTFAALEVATSSGEPSAVLQAKHAFYGALFRGAQNRVISEVADKLFTRTNRVRIVSYARRQRMRTGFHELEGVMSAIRAKDQEGAHRAYDLHLTRAEAASVESLRYMQARASNVTGANGAVPEPEHV